MPGLTGFPDRCEPIRAAVDVLRRCSRRVASIRKACEAWHDGRPPTDRRGAALAHRGVAIPAGRVISVFVDLDPSQFGPRARPGEFARRRAVVHVEALADELAHDELTALQTTATASATSWLISTPRAPGGSRCSACGPADVWEVLRLPFSVGPERRRRRGGRTPRSGATAEGRPRARPGPSRSSRAPPGGARRRSRRVARAAGPRGGGGGTARAGGWSQARFERSVDREADEHVRASVEHTMHAELREILAGRVDADIPGASPEDVLAVVRPEMHQGPRGARAQDCSDTSRSGWAVANARLWDCTNTRRVACREGWRRSLLLDGFAAPGTRARLAAGWARRPSTAGPPRWTASGRSGGATASRRAASAGSGRRRSCASAT